MGTPVTDPDDELFGGDPLPLVAPRRRSLTTVLPVIAWLPDYRWRSDLRPDLIAGLTVAALMIPESMGYAGVAGVPPEIGLYAALGAIAAYFLTGGTSILFVGPASAVAALSASIVADFTGDVDPIALTSALAITSGVLLLVAGALRLGWVVNFISKPVLHAFVAGLSISILVGQLDELVGIDIDGESAVAKFVDTMSQLPDWQGWTVVVGFGGLAALLLMERFVPRLPGALFVVIVGIVLVVLFGLDDNGVAIVGDIPSGLPGVGIPDLSATRWIELFGGGAALLLVGFSEGYAAASTVSESTGEDVDSDQELVGAGAANIAAGLVGGQAVSGSLSKSAAAEEAGARTQMSNLISGVVLLMTLLFLAPVFEQLPEPILAAVVIAAVVKSADPRRLVGLWNVNRFDFVAGVVTFTLVLVWEALPAILVGVAMSLAFLVRRATFPDVVELRPSPDGVFRRSVRPVDKPARDGVVALRLEGSLTYANAERFIRGARLLADREGVRVLVVDAEMMADLDTTGAEALEFVDDDLGERGIEVRLAAIHARARAQIARSRLSDRFEGRLYDSVEAAAGQTAAS
ncbi:MAG: SulP family inorganic anion transporter [Ilumatobacter fluminis]|uniref:SulP family inorganic anion transporter n=1 Tax=Ilumatobacter fluminis TaxID=467091 RepID=UPI0032F025F2